MKIIVARTAGVCMGVRRAIEMAQKAAAGEGRKVYTYGPLIHNPQELERLRGEGIEPLPEGPLPPRATVVIRAHGVTPEVQERLASAAQILVDATCPKVASIQEQIREYTRQGYSVVIAGDPDHPEVEGLVGCAGGAAFVVRSPEEIDALPGLGRVLLVSQTTQDEKKYRAIRKKLVERFPEAEALDTICSSTRKRQAEVRRMVGEVDAIVVIGGKNSANTRRLYEISREAGARAYYVESAGELPLEEFGGVRAVGVTAGASTPEWIVREVVAALERL